MAAGSHAEKGICALFVHAAAAKSLIIQKFAPFEKSPLIKHNATTSSSSASPIRFVIAVNIPAANAFSFL